MADGKGEKEKISLKEAIRGIREIKGKAVKSIHEIRREAVRSIRKIKTG